jgi:ketosteroid isomerase-like protein
MSQENVELIHRAIEVFNEDPASDEALSLLDPEVAWEENNPFYPGLEPVYRGWEGYLRWLQQAVIEPFQEFEIITDRLEDLGDQVLASIRLRGTGRGSGVKVEMEIFQLVAIRDGRLSRRRIFHARDEALRAAALRE